MRGGIIKYGAYEVMTGDLGCRGEKGEEYKEYSTYWTTRAPPGHQFMAVQLVCGWCFDVKTYSWTAWKHINTHTRDMKTNFLCGPYSNSYTATIKCTEKLLVISLGEVVARQFTSTDDKTWTPRGLKTKLEY